LPYPLGQDDVDAGCANRFVFTFLDKVSVDVNNYSMGITFFRITGFFEVGILSLSGSKKVYSLKEINVPAATRQYIERSGASFVPVPSITTQEMMNQ